MTTRKLGLFTFPRRPMGALLAWGVFTQLMRVARDFLFMFGLFKKSRLEEKPEHRISEKDGFFTAERLQMVAFLFWDYRPISEELNSIDEAKRVIDSDVARLAKLRAPAKHHAYP